MDTLLANFDFPSLLETLSKFLQEISCRLGLFALHNYLHEVVTPGIPEFPNWKELTRFWVDVCVDKLKKNMWLHLHKRKPHYTKSYGRVQSILNLLNWQN